MQTVEIDLILKGIKTNQVFGAHGSMEKFNVEIDLILKGIKTSKSVTAVGLAFLCM